MSPTCSVVRRIEADHPSFAGHFPGQPVLPGVVLLAEVMEALRGAGLPDRPGERFDMRAVKFLWPVRPGDDIRIDLQGEAGRARFEVHCGGKVAASGQVVWSAA
ncbi:3-hydroxyacyl-ACP dehydratase FabZ family protein [uncultured Azohydromonas sp.]|jgi:3-hydroxymyristoyl/3-hydroxydecanoyl-(acyl carrier protein) dehydratases|uniref:3-hydroxyacyl-ACP dehydratase FabZ family protein n=1 Tax=uncultured Azohydromonas sp. TaxID=487342 RepID=UPI0026256F91|nr:MaoC/PaaZ C-terminal domain-containing protein [uncultured Azohydromonas sp.]